MDQGKKYKGVLSEINVTPLVDVMLVLLIIFMVTAPLMQQGIDVNLPKAKGKELAAEEERIIVTITKGNKIYITGTLSNFKNLARSSRRSMNGGPIRRSSSRLIRISLMVLLSGQWRR